MNCITCKISAADETNVAVTEALVPAGSACTSVVCGALTEQAVSGLAQIYFPVQTYSEGYCPVEALEQGTLFPGLVL